MNSILPMTYHVFDLLYVEPEQVREFLTAVAKEGLVGGVYLWINRVNSKMYVGSSLNLYSRISGYLRLSKLHGVIGPALLKYGLDSFVLVIFLIPNATSSLVLALEQSVLDGCVCAYNINPTAGSRAGVEFSEEHKAKISAAQKGNSNCKGYKHTEETKAKMSDAKRGECNPQYGKPLSEETKAKISASMEGKSHSDGARQKMSAAKRGVCNPQYGKGVPVHLFQVTPSGLKHVLSFPNQNRCVEGLGLSTTLEMYGDAWQAKRFSNTTVTATLLPANSPLIDLNSPTL